MKLIGLQIVASIIFLIGGIFLIFKRKNGWLFHGIGIAIIIYINYLVGLYFLMVPCLFSIIVVMMGYIKWRKDEQIKRRKKE